MGVVYRATHLALERPVALKVIAHHLAQDPAFRERFLHESRLAARLEHPNVVPVYDAREEGGELIVAMRLIEGGDLKRKIAADGPLPPDRAVDLLGQVAEALDSAHAAGIVHRDVKPHNILLEGESAFLTDFGLAKALGDSGVLSGVSVAGTVEYMSPEQWRGHSVGPAADVYSLGCVLYEALTGIVPYARKEDDTEPEMPEGLDAVIERAVSKEPERRYPSAGAMIAAARERQGAAPAATRVLSETSGRPTIAQPHARPRRPALTRGRGLLLAALTGVLALAALAAVLLLGGDGVSVSSPIEVGGGPLRLASGRRSLWVTSARDGTLTKIDLSGEAIVGSPLRLGRGLAGVAVGEGSVWVSSPRSGEVLRIDGDRERVEQRIRVGGRPGAIAFGGGRIWVADEGGAGITAINAAGGRVFKRGIPPRRSPLRLAVGAGGLWVSSASTGSVRRIDLGSAASGPPIQVGRGPSGVTVGGGVVWVANSRSNSVTRLDPATHALLGVPIGVGERPGGIDAGTSTVWVANAAEDSVSRIGIESGETVGDPIGVGSRPGAVAVDEQSVWVADNGDGTVIRIVP
jgi:serine/threonine-protein kinase